MDTKGQPANNNNNMKKNNTELTLDFYHTLAWRPLQGRRCPWRKVASICGLRAGLKASAISQLIPVYCAYVCVLAEILCG